MAEPHDDTRVSKADVALLLSVIRARFINLDPAESMAVVLAMEGLRWLLGQNSAVNHATLEYEFNHWEQYSIVSVEPEWP